MFGHFTIAIGDYISPVESTYHSVVKNVSTSLQTIKSATFGDLYSLYRSRSNFITTELYERSLETGVAIACPGPSWMSSLPRYVVVSGSEANLRLVTDYGERTDSYHPNDPAARNLLSRAISEVTGKNEDEGGEESLKRRRILKTFLSESESMVKVHAKCLSFAKELFDYWHENITFQNNIGFYAANMIGHNVLGIPHVNIEDIGVLRAFEEFIIKNEYDSVEYHEIKERYAQLRKELLEHNTTEIFSAQKAIYALLQDRLSQDENIDVEELKKEILATSGAAGLFPTGNTTMLLAGSIAYITKSDIILTKLREELEGNPDWKQDWQTLMKLPYLNAVYLESLRIMSPTALVARSTSRQIDLTVEGRDKQLHTVTLPPHSVLFAPLRRVNNDPNMWINPREFYPERFLTEDKRSYLHTLSNNYFVPFSLGVRSCPAGTKFVPLIFKSLLAVLCSGYTLKLDKEVEDIPVESPCPRWKQDYYASVTPVVPQEVHTNQSPKTMWRGR